MSKYRYIPAVKQINNMACWAASLKWWYKAAMSISASQQKLFDLYKARATQQGGMPDADMKYIIGQNGMQLIEFPIATGFTFGKVRDLLMCGPIFTAYTESYSSRRHVNVIYEVKGSEDYAEVRAMEPQAFNKSGSSWDGKHMTKPLTDFNLIGSVWAGVNRGNYYDWWSCFGDL